MAATIQPDPNLPQPAEGIEYWRQVLEQARAWASAHRPLLSLVFGEFDRTGSWPKRDELKRELARSSRDFRILDAVDTMPQLVGWVDRSSGEMVLKPLALSVVATAQPLLDQFIGALKLAVASYLGADPSPKLSGDRVQAALRIDDPSLWKLGKILVNEHLWLGSTTDPSGAFVEALVSDRVLEFADVSDSTGYLEVSARISYPGPRIAPTGLPSRFMDDLAAYQAQTGPKLQADQPEAKRWMQLHPQVYMGVQRHLDAGLHAEAVLAAYALIRDLVRERSGLYGLDGQDLYGKALNPDKPLIVLAELDSKTGKDYQRGIMLFCQGVAATIRNPLIHRKHELTDDEAAEMLGAISLLYRKLAPPPQDGASTTS